MGWEARTRSVGELLEGHKSLLDVSDDGHGFDSCEVSPEHIGLRSMAERASEVGAELDVDGVIGGGTTVTLEWAAESQA